MLATLKQHKKRPSMAAVVHAIIRDREDQKAAIPGCTFQ
jgi:hypothetical protein